LGIFESFEVEDGTVVRVKKAYPSYTGEYRNMELVVGDMNKFDNLFLIGRNGMHRYNNQDHSMLAAMTVVDNIIKGSNDKRGVWAVNIGDDYYEEE
jgi:protoporphyrinogen oxidase